MLSIVGIGGKGGVGKSTLALNIARMLGCQIVTNDKMSKLDILANKDEVIVMDEVEFIEDSEYCIYYDFGGYVDENMVDIVKRADVVIFITTAEPLSFGQLADYIEDLLPYNDNAFIIANKLGLIKQSKEGKQECINRELKTIEEEVGNQFGLKVYPIKSSSKINEGFGKGASLAEELESYPFKGAWKTEIQQLQNILIRINQ